MRWLLLPILFTTMTACSWPPSPTIPTSIPADVEPQNEALLPNTQLLQPSVPQLPATGQVLRR
jgi:hypothetical protein